MAQSLWALVSGHAGGSLLKDAEVLVFVCVYYTWGIIYLGLAFTSQGLLI